MVARLLVIGMVWSLGAADEASAQTGFDTWSIEDGLPQNSVNDIVQTRDGYLWLATYGGLVRFDGTRFVVFDRSVRGVDSLRARVLHEDPTGTLWAATDDGMVLRYKDGTFTTFGSDDGLPAEAALRIDTDQAGALWIMWRTVITKFDGRAFTNYEPRHFARGVLPRVEAPMHYATHSTWWSRDRDGIHCLRAGVVGTCVASQVLPAEDVLAVSVDPTGAIWIRFRRSVMRVAGNDRRTFTSRTESNQRRLYLTDRVGRSWEFGLDGVVRRLDTGTGQSVSAATVLTMYEDRDGSLWFGTTSGLRRLRTTSITVRDTSAGLSSNNVYAMLRRQNDDIWVGTWGAGLIRLVGSAVRSYGVSDGLPSGEITTLFEDSAGRLWAGTTRGLAFLDGGRFVREPSRSDWLSGSVWAIQEDPTGVLWFGTERGLVRRLNDRLARFTTVDGLPDNRVRALSRDRAGRLWIGTAQGLGRYHDGRFETIAAADGQVGKHVRAIYEDADAAVWIGTYDGGLYRWREGRLTRYTTREGLYDNGVFQILEDADGYFWMGSNRGIQRVARAALNAVADGRARSVAALGFGLQDGMTSLECNGGRQPSGLKMADGTLWIPTQGGIAMVDPRGVAARPQPPPVRIEELRFRGDSLPFASGLAIPAGHNTLEVRYTAISFVKPDQVRFRYRMIGLDDEWVEAGGSRSVTYSRLPAGEYEFVVTAASADGAWHEAGDRVRVVVQAPVWMRGWFLAATGATAVALVVIAQRRRVVRLRRAHDRQQGVARQLLEAQERERRRISNELHDSLGQTLFLIRQRVRSAATRNDGSTEERMHTLGEIEELASAAYDEMKDIAYALRPYELDRIGLSRTLKGMLQRVSAACGLHVTDEIEEVDAMLTAGEASHVFRIVQEAMNNVVRHAGARHARVALTHRAGQIEIEVADDGQGIPGRPSADGGWGSPGAGLAGIRERASALGGSAIIDSRPPHGTRLIVEFPIKGAES